MRIKFERGWVSAYFNGQALLKRARPSRTPRCPHRHFALIPVGGLAALLNVPVFRGAYRAGPARGAQGGAWGNNNGPGRLEYRCAAEEAGHAARQRPAHVRRGVHVRYDGRRPAGPRQQRHVRPARAHLATPAVVLALPQGWRVGPSRLRRVYNVVVSARRYEVRSKSGKAMRLRLGQLGLQIFDSQDKMLHTHLYQ